MKRTPEISWSLMHPVQPEPAYMRDVIAAATNYHVDSFEICGDVHGCGGGLDGSIRFRDYPAAAARLDSSRVQENISKLREVVALAHASGRPVYYWHREVMVPRAVVEEVPGLLDENGEFDLLGVAYQSLVRSKIAEFLENVPAMDGLVLTLTESDYSVIHNSDPRRYPPQEVVRQLVETFAEELKRRNKRLILRSFGSIAQDYEDILAGAALVPPEFAFEIETKITPYDFSPFLPFNPYLRATAGRTLSAEYDSIGEFLGAGFLPAADPARVIASVAYARQNGVDRHVIRVDRIGHATFDSPQAINLLAFDRAIREPKTTAEEIWNEWSTAKWPRCPGEMTAAMQPGIQMVKQTHFIGGNVIFHAFPIHAELKWIQACGILSLFSPGRTLRHHEGMWGIQPEGTTPSRADLLREKDDAVERADAGVRAITALRDRLTESEYCSALTAWHNAAMAARAIRVWCRCFTAYFDDMEAGYADHFSLNHAIGSARMKLAELGLGETPAPAMMTAKHPQHEYGDPEPVDDSMEAAYLRPIRRHVELLPEMFESEFRERAQWRRRAGVVDYVVCGGLLDDIRVVRYMHASHTRLVGTRLARVVGNRVFPNGFLAVQLTRPPGLKLRLIIQGDAGRGRLFMLTIDGATQQAEFSAAGEFQCEIPDADAGRTVVDVRIQKRAETYPAIFGLATAAMGE